ncbi:MAG: hypothetical protein ACAI43_02885 [Phycisphaerae bacterium]|nr:hypothetical protein [Tepidisphaeraceae bacterium]
MRYPIAVVITLATWASAAPAADAPPTLRRGDTVTVAGSRTEVRKVDALPLVDSDYSRRFRFDAFDNPKLKQLRERYKLDEVVAAGKDEFDKQVLLLDWSNRQFKKFGKPSSKARGAMDVLAAIDDGHTFFCAHYADVLVSAAASLGWYDRPLALRRPDHLGEGSTEHTSTEMWSNVHRKWVMMDPTFAMYAEKAGVPLSAYELRQEWFLREGRDVTFVVGTERTRYRKSDLPVLRGKFPGFGDLNLDASAITPYAFIGYIPSTDLMDRGPDYAKMFITQDEIGAGTKWHKRDVPKDPATDPYFPIHQAAVSLTRAETGLRVSLVTLTPNFKGYEVRVDGGEWKPTPAEWTWTPHAGANKLEVRAVNQFGVPGAASIVEVDVAR